MAARHASYSLARLAAPLTPLVALSSSARCFIAARSALVNPVFVSLTVSPPRVRGGFHGAHARGRAEGPASRILTDLESHGCRRRTCAGYPAGSSRWAR